MFERSGRLAIAGLALAGIILAGCGPGAGRGKPPATPTPTPPPSVHPLTNLPGNLGLIEGIDTTSKTVPGKPVYLYERLMSPDPHNNPPNPKDVCPSVKGQKLNPIFTFDNGKPTKQVAYVYFCESDSPPT